MPPEGDGATIFGRLLREYRRAAGLTQAELAERAGLSERGIQNLERGARRPYPATLERLASALHLALDERTELQAAVLAISRRTDEQPASRYRLRRDLPGRAASPGLGPQGERKSATVLCARLANAPLLAARLRPPDLRRVLDGFVKLATREVERYGGVVQRLDDSGLVALFGVPVAQEDHAARALHAALGIRDALAADRARDPRGRELALIVSAGLDSGPLVVRRAHGAWTLGEDEAGPLERAVRLQRAAAGGTVQVAEATWRAAGSGFVGRAVGPIATDEHGEPVQVYELLRAAGPRRRDTRMPLVGRAAELAELRATWTQARSGQGRVVSLVGEAGIGKSRLLAELQRDLAAANTRCLVGSCYAHADAISYLPFREVLRVCFDVEEAAPSLARPRVVARLAALGLDAGAIAPYLFHVLGYAVDDPLFAQLPVHLVRARAVEAVQAVLLAEAASRPLALVLEDFHWIDKGSEEIVGALVEALADRPVLLVLAYRPEYLHPWAHEPSHTTVSLGPLPRASAAALARAIPARAHATRVAVGPLASADAEVLARGVAGERGLSSALVRRVASQGGREPAIRGGADSGAAGG